MPLRPIFKLAFFVVFFFSLMGTSFAQSRTQANRSQTRRSTPPPSASTSSQLTNYFADVRRAFDGEKAYQTVGYVESRWRIAGNTGFNESIHFAENILKQAGYIEESVAKPTDVLTYRIEKRPMSRPTWDPFGATVQLEGDTTPLLDLRTNKNMLAINSAPTNGAVTAEVVYVGQGRAADFEGKDVTGKIVFGENGVGSLYRTAIAKGAIGVFAYSIPNYNQASKHPTSISFQGIPSGNLDQQKWGILLSFQAKERLKEALAKGTVKAQVNVQSKIYNSEELTLVADVRGAVKPSERFVFSAHVQEPGANDNATGVGTLAEMARVTANLVKSRKFAPQRTISFLWGDEIISTRRYINDDATRATGILWGMSLDMVGEDTQKTGGTFLIEKMPDPSAVWTRGDEKHTEWGGSPIPENRIVPHYFNDFILNRCLDQAKTNGWVVKTNPFEGGSDHTPFLDAKKPGLLMWHFTDVYYHTDGDRLDMVSKDEMKNVGVSALVSAMILTTANEATARALVTEMQQTALKRLEVEFNLSKAEVVAGKSKEEQAHILEVWSKYYQDAIDKLIEVPVQATSKFILVDMATAKNRIQTETQRYVTTLKQ